MNDLMAYKMTTEHKEKIRKALSGKKKSLSSCEKMGKTKIGNKNMLGRHHSEESRKKMSIKHMGKILSKEHVENREKARKNNGTPPSMLGKTHSEETKRKMSQSHRGEKHHFWNGGRTTLRRRIRNSFRYKDWRTAGFKRDKFFCVLGGEEHGSTLHFDHIVPFARILDLYNITTIEEAFSCEDLWKLENGRTLCEKCHRNTPTWGRKKYG